MGIASSLNLTNLYNIYFKRKCKALKDACMVFYRKYIDDCLAIVYGSTKTEVKALVSQLVFDDCAIIWDMSGVITPFLDMLIYKNSYWRLQHMLYCKAYNHQESVSWISHHPFDVKKEGPLLVKYSIWPHYLVHITHTWKYCNFWENCMSSMIIQWIWLSPGLRNTLLRGGIKGLLTLKLVCSRMFWYLSQNSILHGTISSHHSLVTLL